MKNMLSMYVGKVTRAALLMGAVISLFSLSAFAAEFYKNDRGAAKIYGGSDDKDSYGCEACMSSIGIGFYEYALDIDEDAYIPVKLSYAGEQIKPELIVAYPTQIGTDVSMTVESDATIRAKFWVQYNEETDEHYEFPSSGLNGEEKFHEVIREIREDYEQIWGWPDWCWPNGANADSIRVWIHVTTLDKPGRKAFLPSYKVKLGEEETPIITILQDGADVHTPSERVGLPIFWATARQIGKVVYFTPNSVGGEICAAGGEWYPGCPRWEYFSNNDNDEGGHYLGVKVPSQGTLVLRNSDIFRSGNVSAPHEHSSSEWQIWNGSNSAYLEIHGAISNVNLDAEHGDIYLDIDKDGDVYIGEWVNYYGGEEEIEDMTDSIFLDAIQFYPEGTNALAVNVDPLQSVNLPFGSSYSVVPGKVTGVGSYKAGQTFTITAEGKCGNIFDHWETDSDLIRIADRYSATTTVTVTSDNPWENGDCPQATIRAVWNMPEYEVGKFPLDVKGWEGRRDGQSHSVSVKALDGTAIQVQYSTDSGKTWSSTAPSFSDVGNHVVNYKVTANGYSSSGTVAVNIKSELDIRWEECNGGVVILSITGQPLGGTLTIPNEIEGKKVVAIGTDALNPDDSSTLTGITTLTIPKTVTSIAHAALGCNTSLTKIIVEEGNPKYSTVDNGKLLLELSGSDYAVIQAASYPNGTITIPEGVVAIRYEAFANMKIGKIVFPSTLKTVDKAAFNSIEGVTELDFSGTRLNSIGYKAFEDHTSIQTLKFPATLENIGSYAFADNKALKSVYFLGGIPSVDGGIFTDTANVVVYVGANKGWDDYATGGTKWNGATVSYDPNYKAFTGEIYGFWADNEEGDIWKYEDSRRESDSWMEEFANINGHKEPAQWACGEGDGFAIPVTVAAGKSVTPQITEGSVSCRQLSGLTDIQMRDMICKDSDWEYDYYAQTLWPNGKTIDTRAWIVVVPNGINTSPKYRMNLLETKTMSGKESIKSYSDRHGITAPNYVDVAASVSFKVKIVENGAIFGERLWFVPAPYNYNSWYKKFVDTLEDNEEVDDIEEVMARGLWLVTPEMLAKQQAYKPTTKNIDFTMPTAYRGEAYSFNHTEIDIGEFVPEKVEVTGLPSGMSFTNGVIAGTPSATGTWNVTVTFTNMYDDKIVATSELVIRPFQLEVSADGTLSGIRGGLTATGGKLTIPAEVDGIEIKAISDDAFSRCTDLKLVYFLGDKPQVWATKLFNNAAEVTVYVLPDQGWDDDVEAGTWQGVQIVYLATADGFMGEYDGKPHTITTSVAANAGASFVYSATKDGNYGPYAPSFTNAGKNTVYYKLMLNGETIGSYDDDVNITPKQLTDAMVKDFEDLEYTGSALTPAAKFNEPLITANDYTLSYANNVSYGTATVTIIGKNNFVGQVQKTFKVAKTLILYTAAGYTGIYDGEAHGITINVTKPASGAKVEYTTANQYTDVGEYTVGYKITAGGDFETVENKSEIVKITPKTLTDAMVTPAAISGTFVENGTPITPAVTVADGSILKASDYQVSYENNLTRGTATIRITAKGNYTGVVTRTFFINGKMNKDLMSEKPLDKEWNGRWDGKAHGTSINVKNVEGAYVYYRIDSKGAWSTTIPTFTDVGEYTVYYKVEANGWETFEGAYVVEILTQYDWFADNGDGIITRVDPTPKGDLVIPVEFNGTSFCGLATELFNGNKELTSVMVPEEIKILGDRVFANCEKLTSVTFEDDCPTTCGKDLYLGSKNVTTYVAPDSTESWGGDDGDMERLPKTWMDRPILYIGGIVPKDFEVVVTGFFGYEDGFKHGISVSAKYPPADMKLYFLVEGKYVEKMPMFTAPGTYEVTYKLMAEGYYSAKGTATVVIQNKIEPGKITKDPDMPVEYGWLDANAQVLGLPKNPTEADYEKAAKKKITKAHGTFTAFQEYVMGTTPSDPNSIFQVMIDTDDITGHKVLKPSPDMRTQHRVYRYSYSTDLKNWIEVSEEEIEEILNPNPMARSIEPTKFFKADVDLDDEIKAAAQKVQNGVTGGDMDSDGKLDTNDLNRIKDIIWDVVYTKKLTVDQLSKADRAAADVNNDGIIDEGDLIAIYMLIEAQK